MLENGQLIQPYWHGVVREVITVAELRQIRPPFLAVIEQAGCNAFP
jgi:hypothetical protein